HTCVGDWALAESSMQAYIKQGIIEEWPLDALMRTGLHPEIRDTLQQLVEDGCTTASERLRILEEHNGWDIGCLQRHENSSSDADNKPYEGDVTVFRPEQLEDLLKVLEPYYKERPKLLRTWYQHWESQKQGRNLLVELDKILFAKNNKWMREALHLSEFAFQTKRRLSGLTAAWKYLVHAQIRNGGWIGYMENVDVTCKRLDLVVQNYPQRCDEFVAVTTYNMFDEPVSSRLAPSEVMVYFYVKQNRIDEAVKFTETMVNCVIEDTRTLPLEPPCWMSKLLEPIAQEVK
ncbi:ATP-binding protein, partial [Escherichia coli]|nr:ATP-binding protein [Escherichia coli]